MINQTTWGAERVQLGAGCYSLEFVNGLEPRIVSLAGVLSARNKRFGASGHAADELKIGLNQGRAVWHPDASDLTEAHPRAWIAGDAAPPEVVVEADRQLVVVTSTGSGRLTRASHNTRNADVEIKVSSLTMPPEEPSPSIRRCLRGDISLP